jgi:hypothetical protein
MQNSFGEIAGIDATCPKNVKFPEKNEIPHEALSRAEKKWNF